jgi:lipid-A-disaccharide synthase
MSHCPSIFISAGEASGEHYGALLVAALQQRLAAVGQTAQFFGMGGERMKAAGLETVVRSEDMAVMGLTEILHHLPHIWREFRKLKRAIRERRPSVAVLIDFPEIHFRLAEELHRLGIPVIFFVSPQLWAWKKHRIKLVEKYIDRMLVIFPFEEPFYRSHGVKAEFVGHPLAELPQPSVSREQFAAEDGLDAAKTWIGLLPGSRPKEIRDNLPEILKAAAELERNREGSPGWRIREAQISGAKAPIDSESLARGLKPPSPSDTSSSPRCKAESFQFVIPLAATLNGAQRDEVRQLVEAHGGGLDVRLVEDARAALFHARASVVASGTATVEAALIGNPFVVVYRVSPITFAIAKRVVKVDHVAMANLIAGKRVVTELIQDDFTAENIVQEIERLLPDGPQRQSMIEELATIRGLLKTREPGHGESGGAIGRVAAVTLELLGLSPRAGE